MHTEASAAIAAEDAAAEAIAREGWYEMAARFWLTADSEMLRSKRSKACAPKRKLPRENPRVESFQAKDPKAWISSFRLRGSCYAKGPRRRIPTERFPSKRAVRKIPSMLTQSSYMKNPSWGHAVRIGLGGDRGHRKALRE